MAVGANKSQRELGATINGFTAIYSPLSYYATNASLFLTRNAANGAQMLRITL